ncbi:hypothetical protein [Pontibacter oryzae]|uniref:VCBS repeat-containing protein n=1 Tax=Pontibacter oryzae TaxID=2304593 RepID=A0A399SLQ6_9BACT|nr:hypothetical protein [Pontibacter oryzae]RIJ42715.1 hypothetical protein D1627_02390 [Pontibacter oryzae]
MKRIHYLLASALFLLACSPENEQVQDENIDVGPPSEALDSIADTPKDGVATDNNNINPTLPLPQPVMQLLAQKYAGWQKPELSEAALQHPEVQTGSAAITRGDFDGDTRQDVALQLQQGKEVVVVAALQYEEMNYKLVELKRDILFNNRGSLTSLYYLYTLGPGQEVTNQETGQPTRLPHDAVVLGIEDAATLYYINGDSIQKFNIAKD